VQAKKANVAENTPTLVLITNGARYIQQMNNFRSISSHCSSASHRVAGSRFSLTKLNRGNALKSVQWPLLVSCLRCECDDVGLIETRKTYYLRLHWD